MSKYLDASECQGPSELRGTCLQTGGELWLLFV